MDVDQPICPVLIFYLHYFSIRMIAFDLCIMALIKYQKCNVLNPHEAVR